MSDSEVEIFAHVPNSGIVQMPGRRFPAVAIQGDTLRSWLAYLEELKDLKEKRDWEEFDFVLNDLMDHLGSQLEHYQDTLKEKGMSLPYTNPVTSRKPNTEQDEPGDD